MTLKGCRFNKSILIFNSTLFNNSMSKASTQSTTLMDDLLENYQTPYTFAIGDMIEGTIINKKKNCILIDINGALTGIISGKETKDALNTAKKAEIGDIIAAVVIGAENDEGYIPLSLKESGHIKSWDKLLKIYESKETMKIKAKEANKGGLLIELDGITGFLPVSQLAPLHYPRVDDADTSKILQKLQKLISIEFDVKIIAIEKDTGKLIFSEKEVFKCERDKELKKLKIGEKIKGRISGVVKFGLFVTFNGLEGLVHISEIEWGHVTNPENYGKIGQEVEALVIGIDNEKISLSIKQLTSDPWMEAAEKIKLGQIIKGKINRITDFGAFIPLNDQINGLIHLSEIFKQDGSAAKNINDVLKVGDEVETRVIAIDPKDHRIGLSMKLEADEKKSKKKDENEEENEDEESKEEKKSKKSSKKETEEE